VERGERAGGDSGAGVDSVEEGPHRGLAATGEGEGEMKGKCALGPFLSILVIECQLKVLKCEFMQWMNKVQI
jgi:hypothetical protein